MEHEDGLNGPFLKRSATLMTQVSKERSETSETRGSPQEKKVRVSGVENSGTRSPDFSKIDGEESPTHDDLDDSSDVDELSDSDLIERIANKPRTEVLAELDEVIEKWKQCIEQHPLGGRDRAIYHEIVIQCFQDRYNITRDIKDLEQQIKSAEKAVQEAPAEFRGAALHNLSIALYERFSEMGTGLDLDEGIKYARQACNAITNDQPQMSRTLAYLAQMLGERYSRTRVPAHLDEAVEVASQAAKVAPDDDPRSAAVWVGLGNVLQEKWEHMGSAALADLHEAVKVTRKAVALTPRFDPDRSARLNSLGTALGHVYLETGDVKCLDESIESFYQATEWSKEEIADQAIWLYNLGNRLQNRYSITKKPSDAEESIGCYRKALGLSSAPLIHRILAGEAILLHSTNWQESYEAAKSAIELIPKLTSWSLENSDKQNLISQLFGIASCGATAALMADQSPLTAVQLLEQGRGVLVASLDAMQVDIADLQERHPELAERFIRLRDDVDSHLAEEGSQFNRRYEVGKELDQVIDDIRKEPGFQRFLLSPSDEDILAAAKYGPVVIINVSEWACNAFLVTEDHVRDLDLPVSVEDVNRMAKQEDLGHPAVLEWLWDEIASPILNALGIDKPPRSADDWPHIWWIPTGPLSKFPIHAAGRYLKDTVSDTVLDRVISSYSLSIQTLIQQRKRRTVSAPGPARALLVAIEHTPGRISLPFTTQEVEILRDLCSSMGLESLQPGRGRLDILSVLADCSIFHFAGHGDTNNHDPLQSHLCLEPSDTDDGELTVADMMRLRLGQRGPFLAYLSACGTGRIQEDRFVDESIHLISACQLAGFRHVVGTLWEVNDRICVGMAKIIYEEIKRHGMTDVSVCRGLHMATRELRRRWMDGLPNEMRKSKVSTATVEEGVADKKNTERGDRTAVLWVGEDSPSLAGGRDWSDWPLYWVPYVHYGV